MNLAKIASAVVPAVLLTAGGSAYLASSAQATVARSAPASTAAKPAHKPASIQRTASRPVSTGWLGTPGGQAQVKVMQAVDTLVDGNLNERERVKARPYAKAYAWTQVGERRSAVRHVGIRARFATFGAHVQL